LQRRLPKRGFHNPFRIESRIVNLHILQSIDDTEFDIEKLEKLDLIRKLRKNEKSPVKILADKKEEFNKKITIKSQMPFPKQPKKLLKNLVEKAEVI